MSDVLKKNTPLWITALLIGGGAAVADFILFSTLEYGPMLLVAIGLLVAVAALDLYGLIDVDKFTNQVWRVFGLK